MTHLCTIWRNSDKCVQMIAMIISPLFLFFFLIHRHILFLYFRTMENPGLLEIFDVARRFVSVRCDCKLLIPNDIMNRKIQRARWDRADISRSDCSKTSMNRSSRDSWKRLFFHRFNNEFENSFCKLHLFPFLFSYDQFLSRDISHGRKLKNLGSNWSARDDFVIVSNDGNNACNSPYSQMSDAQIEFMNIANCRKLFTKWIESGWWSTWHTCHITLWGVYSRSRGLLLYFRIRLLSVFAPTTGTFPMTFCTWSWVQQFFHKRRSISWMCILSFRKKIEVSLWWISTVVS